MAKLRFRTVRPLYLKLVFLTGEDSCFFLQFQQCRQVARAVWQGSETTFTSADSLALLSPRESCKEHIGHMCLRQHPRHRLCNVERQRWKQEDDSECVGLLPVVRGVETWIAGLEEKQEPELILPCAGDRLVKGLVGKGSVHWLRISRKHGASKDHLGGQLVNQSWVSHFSFHGFISFCSVRVGDGACCTSPHTSFPPLATFFG